MYLRDYFTIQGRIRRRVEKEYPLYGKLNLFRDLYSSLLSNFVDVRKHTKKENITASLMCFRKINTLLSEMEFEFYQHISLLGLNSPIHKRYFNDRDYLNSLLNQRYLIVQDKTEGDAIIKLDFELVDYQRLCNFKKDVMFIKRHFKKVKQNVKDFIL